MIDWYIIDYLYPNAMKLFSETTFPNVGLPSLSLLSYFDVKKLYKFFDKNGIYLTVEMLTKNSWGFMISLSDGRVIVPNQNSKPNRESIEIDGFYECFKILENKLTIVSD